MLACERLVYISFLAEGLGEHSRLPDSGLDARNSRTNKTPGPWSPGSHPPPAGGRGTGLQSTLMESAKCHDAEEPT